MRVVIAPPTPTTCAIQAERRVLDLNGARFSVMVSRPLDGSGLIECIARSPGAVAVAELWPFGPPGLVRHSVPVLRFGPHWGHSAIERPTIETSAGLGDDFGSRSEDLADSAFAPSSLVFLAICGRGFDANRKPHREARLTQFDWDGQSRRGWSVPVASMARLFALLNPPHRLPRDVEVPRGWRRTGPRGVLSVRTVVCGGQRMDALVVVIGVGDADAVAVDEVEVSEVVPV